jgi:hypothetical protein
MTALANSLLRVWSAKGRNPRLTGRGQSGASYSAAPESLASWAWERLHLLRQTAQRTLPVVLAFALQILR